MLENDEKPRRWYRRWGATRTAGAIAAATLSVGAVAVGATPAVAISGGSVSNVPWVVQVQGSNGQSCTGFALNASWVVTAQHCDFPLAGVAYPTGSNGTFGAPQPVDRSIAPPLYMNLFTPEADVRIVHLRIPHPLSTYPTIDPAYTARDGDLAQLYGRGLPSTGQQRVAAMKVATAFSSHLTVRSVVVPVEGVGRGWGESGDSGGPLVVNGRVVGVLSGGGGRDGEGLGVRNDVANLSGVPGLLAIAHANLARGAAISASSQYNGSYAASNAVDDVVGEHDAGEWASAGERNPTLRLSWTTPQQLGQFVLADRPNLADSVTGGSLMFDDGSTVTIPALPNNGAPVTVTFPQKTVRSVQVRLNGGAASLNTGLSEIQAFTTPASFEGVTAKLTPLGGTSYRVKVTVPALNLYATPEISVQRNGSYSGHLAGEHAWYMSMTGNDEQSRTYAQNVTIQPGDVVQLRSGSGETLRLTP